MRGDATAKMFAGDVGAPAVPPRALILSVAALSVPVAGTFWPVEFAGVQLDVLIWLPALLPAFLLTYYRGWGGASVALAAGMATLAASQSVLWLFVGESPDWRFIMALVFGFVMLCIAVGWFGELLLSARRNAEEAALRDPLTHLPNRGHLRVFLDSAFGAAERGGSLTVIVFDLDKFKRINDDYGHQAGDETLVVFSDLLRSQTRRSDLSARFGGEEFVCVLTGPGGAPGARVFAERLRDALRSHDFPWGPVTASAGIAEYHHGIASPDILIGLADRALYHAKESGRDRTVMADELAPEVVEPPEEEPSAEESEETREKDDGGVARLLRRKDDQPHILVVDDDAFMREGLSRILKRSGFRITAVEDGTAALERLENDVHPDLVLSDLVMPGMGGLTLADRINQAHQGVRVLLVSGYEHDAMMGNLPDSVAGFLQKPLNPPELVGAVRDLLRTRENHEEA